MEGKWPEVGGELGEDRPNIVADLAGRTAHRALEISSLYRLCWEDGVPPCLALYMGARDLNSGSNACVIHQLSRILSPKVCLVIFTFSPFVLGIGTAGLRTTKHAYLINTEFSTFSFIGCMFSVLVAKSTQWLFKCSRKELCAVFLALFSWGDVRQGSHSFHI